MGRRQGALFHDSENGQTSLTFARATRQPSGQQGSVFPSSVQKPISFNPKD
jgi:hypothetical protein